MLFRSGSYECPSDDPTIDSHPAIMLVTAYIVERGLILDPYPVSSKTNEITALEQLRFQIGNILFRAVDQTD